MTDLVLVSAAALIDSARRVLACQRPPNKIYPGKWELPGGKIETGETAQMALVRELHEELAIDVNANDLTPLTFISHSYPQLSVLIPVFLCQRWSGKPLPMENQTLAWVGLKDAGSYDWLSSNAPVMKQLSRYLAAASAR